MIGVFKMEWRFKKVCGWVGGSSPFFIDDDFMAA
jgi:hypothetical protein